MGVPHDELIVGLLIVSLAAWGVLHVLIVSGLLATPPRWQGFVALVFVPLAPYWGARRGMWVRVVLWCGTLVTWLTIRLLFAK
jgi:hypothetical protein